MKNALTGLSLAVATALSLYVSPSADACTDPEKDADKPQVTETTPNGGGNGSDGGFEEAGGSGGTGSDADDGDGSSNGGSGGTNGGASGSNGGGFSEGGGNGSTGSGGSAAGSGSSSGNTSGGNSGGNSGGGFSENGGSGNSSSDEDGVNLGTQVLLLTWSPGVDKDADANNKAYYGHSGHEISTRVVITDRDTGDVVVDELVPQFDYATVKRDVQNKINNRFTSELAPGRYQAKVQSVFFRHGEIKFGLNGKWLSESNLSKRPAIASSVAGANFVVLPSSSGVAGSCAVAQAGGVLPLLALLALARRRRSKR